MGENNNGNWAQFEISIRWQCSCLNGNFMSSIYRRDGRGWDRERNPFRSSRGRDECAKRIPFRYLCMIIGLGGRPFLLWKQFRWQRMKERREQEWNGVGERWGEGRRWRGRKKRKAQKSASNRFRYLLISIYKKLATILSRSQLPFIILCLFSQPSCSSSRAFFPSSLHRFYYQVWTRTITAPNVKSVLNFDYANFCSQKK